MCVSSVMSDPATTWTAARQPPLSMGCSLVHGKNTGVGCHVLSPVLDLSALKSLGCLLQGIFPTQGLNPHLLHWQVDPLTQVPSKKKNEQMDVRHFYPLPSSRRRDWRAQHPFYCGRAERQGVFTSRSGGGSAEWLSTDEYTTMAATNRLLNNETDTTDKRFQS